MLQAVKDCLWAFATLNHTPPEAFLVSSEQHCIRTLGDFTPQNVANAIWAFQKLDHAPQLELLQMVDDQVGPSVASRMKAERASHLRCYSHSPRTWPVQSGASQALDHAPRLEPVQVVDNQVSP